jgi:hypothetical protein
MERIEYFTMNKAAWGDGPWRSEPDKIQWQDEATGLPCLIKRNHMGALCGYVGVAEGHPWFKKGCDAVYGMFPNGVDVHGGLTFADFSQDESSPDDIPHRICHIPGPGEPHRVWWLGFDCSHAFDLAPGMREYSSRAHSENVYRDVPYVEAQIRNLAKQAQEVANGTTEIGSE